VVAAERRALAAEGATLGDDWTALCSPYKGAAGGKRYDVDSVSSEASTAEALDEEEGAKELFFRASHNGAPSAYLPAVRFPFHKSWEKTSPVRSAAKSDGGASVTGCETDSLAGGDRWTAGARWWPRTCYCT
jgi:hypothetical protein